MPELLKFHEKAQTIFVTIESVSGTYQAPTATDALPVTALSGSITNTTGSYTYLGDSLSRDEFSYVTDQYGDFSPETPQQVLGTLNGALTVAEAPLSQELQACGGFVTVFASALGSIPAGTVFIDNATSSNSTLSADLRLSSVQDAVNNKVRRFYGIRGSVDISASVGEVPNLKFNFKGNADPVPVQAPIMVPAFGRQLDNVSASILQTNIVTAEIAARQGSTTALGAIATITRAGNIATVTTSAAHGLGANNSIRFVTIAGATDALYNGTFLIRIISPTQFIYIMNAVPSANASGTLTGLVYPAAKTFCFSTLSASNFFGFDFSRYITGCETGYAKTGVPSDVQVTMLEGASNRVAITGITSTTTVATISAPNHGLQVGNSVTIAGSNVSQYNGTFTVLAGGFTANAFTVTIPTFTGSSTTHGTLTNNSAAEFNPDAEISNFFGVQMKFGTGAGKYVTYQWDKLQIKDSKEGKVSSFFGRAVDFRNTGRSWIILE